MIVIPMAGLSRRFSEAGYDRPKHRLELRGESLFAHAVGSFRAQFETEPFLFIARNEPGTEAFIAREVDRLGLASWRTVMLDAPTRGQADTVRLGIERAGVDPSTALTIFNIDTFRPGYAHPDQPWISTADGWLEVMHASDPGFSFVRPAGGSDQRVAETAEKIVLSDLASTGVYGFRSAGSFLKAFKRTPMARGETYIAPMYNALIASGAHVHYRLVPRHQVILCGTPQEYETLLREVAM